MKLLNRIKKELLYQQKKNRIDPEFCLLVQGKSLEYILQEFKNKEDIEGKIAEKFEKEMNSKDVYSANVLTSAKGFDRLSYSIFYIFVKEIKNRDKQYKITSKIGKDINEAIFLNKYYTIERIFEAINEICVYFQRVGYYKDGAVLLDHPEVRFNYLDLVTNGKTQLLYKMVDPVILDSAQQLNVELGFAGQHFSSRTIQACLKSFGLYGEEVNFNPQEHDRNYVIEKWEITYPETATNRLNFFEYSFS